MLVNTGWEGKPEWGETEFVFFVFKLEVNLKDSCVTVKYTELFNGMQCRLQSTRWRWSPVAMETVHSSYLHAHGLLVPSPPQISPFPSGSTDCRMSLCREGQRGSAAASARPRRTRQSGFSGGEGGSREGTVWRCVCVEGGKHCMSWCWGQMGEGRWKF